MKPLINQEDPGYRSAHAEAVEAVREAIRQDGRLHSEHTIDACAWAAAGALTETDPDLPDGGWLFIRGRVYRVVGTDHHDGNESGDAWTVATRRERVEEDVE